MSEKVRKRELDDFIMKGIRKKVPNLHSSTRNIESYNYWPNREVNEKYSKVVHHRKAGKNNQVDNSIKRKPGKGSNLNLLSS